MNIDRDAERNISQILSNVCCRSGTGGQTSLSSSEEASGWSDVARTGQASSFDVTTDQDIRWRAQTCDNGVLFGQNQNPLQFNTAPSGLGGSSARVSSGGAPGFLDQQTSRTQDEVDTLSTAYQPLPVGGVIGTPTFSHTGGTGEMRVEDKKLKDELIKARATNEKYKKMLVSCSLYTIVYVDDPLPCTVH